MILRAHHVLDTQPSLQQRYRLPSHFLPRLCCLEEFLLTKGSLYMFVVYLKKPYFGSCPAVPLQVRLAVTAAQGGPLARVTRQLGQAAKGNRSRPPLCRWDWRGCARTSGPCSAREVCSAVVTVLDTSVSGGNTEPKPRTGGEEKNDRGQVSELSQCECREAVLIYTARGCNTLRDHQMKSAVEKKNGVWWKWLHFQRVLFI